MGEGPRMARSVCMTWFYSDLTCVFCFLRFFVCLFVWFLVQFISSSFNTDKDFICCFIFSGLKVGYKYTISGQRKTV